MRCGRSDAPYLKRGPTISVVGKITVRFLLLLGVSGAGGSAPRSNPSEPARSNQLRGPIRTSPLAPISSEVQSEAAGAAQELGEQNFYQISSKNNSAVSVAFGDVWGRRFLVV